MTNTNSLLSLNNNLTDYYGLQQQQPFLVDNNLNNNIIGYNYEFDNLTLLQKQQQQLQQRQEELEQLEEISEFADQNQFEEIERYIAIIVPILFAIIVIVGLVGNSLVVIVVKCNPQMRSTTNLLIINLAIADLLFIIFCVPFTAWDYAFTYWPFGSVWCKVVQYLIVVCAYASIYTLVLMSLDRYLAVAHPIRSISLRTVKNANRAILILWLIILLFCVPTIITHNVSYDKQTSNSGCVFLYEEYNHALYQVIFLLFSYVIPIFLLMILYILMLKRLWFTGIPGRNMSSESVRSKKKVTRLVVIVVIIFVCCWCPIQIILVLRSFDLYNISTTKAIIQITAQALAYMNSCMNPILYAFLSENFRKAFRRVISCNRQPKRPVDQTELTIVSKLDDLVDDDDFGDEEV